VSERDKLRERKRGNDCVRDGQTDKRDLRGNDPVENCTAQLGKLKHSATENLISGNSQTGQLSD